MQSSCCPPPAAPARSRPHLQPGPPRQGGQAPAHVERLLPRPEDLGEQAVQVGALPVVACGTLRPVGDAGGGGLARAPAPVHSEPSEMAAATFARAPGSVTFSGNPCS